MLSIRIITKIYKALSDSTRLRILNLLQEEELSVRDIKDTLGVGQSKISRHLAYLKNADLVMDRRDGLSVYYSLSKNELYVPLLKSLKRLRKEFKNLDAEARKIPRKKSRKYVKRVRS